MRIGVGEPAQGSGVGVDSVISNLTSETWLNGKPDGHQSERVVSGFRWDQSQTVLHLTLRNDVYFHDGTLLTPEIAAESLQATVAASKGTFGLSRVTSVSVAGPDGVELRLSEPNAFILSDLAAVTVGNPRAAGASTGPFKLGVRDPQRASLVAFPQYYRERPQLGGIDVVPYPTQRKAWAALMRGEIDMLYDVSRDAVEFVRAESTVRTYTFDRPYYIHLGFNVRHPVLKSAEVRKAINEALDKPMLVQMGLRGQGKPADGPIWPEHWAVPTDVRRFTYDYHPDSAQRRLDAAGFTAARDAVGEMPMRFSFKCLLYAEDSRFERLALLVQKQLADIGIDMKLIPVKREALVVRLSSGDFDAFLFEGYGRSLSYVYEFWHSHERINSGYSAADTTLDRMRMAKSDDDIRSSVADLARILYDDPPAAFIAWQQASRAVSARFDVAAEPGRDILLNLWQWRQVEPTAQAPR